MCENKPRLLLKPHRKNPKQNLRAGYTVESMSRFTHPASFTVRAVSLLVVAAARLGLLQKEIKGLDAAAAHQLRALDFDPEVVYLVGDSGEGGRVGGHHVDV